MFLILQKTPSPNPNYPRNLGRRKCVPFLLMKSSVRSGRCLRSRCFKCLSLDSNPRLLASMPTLLGLHVCVSSPHCPCPRLLGTVGGEEKGALGIILFVLCYLSQINSGEKVKWAQYHIVLELLTTILILTRKKTSFGRNKAPHFHATFLLLKIKKALQFCAYYFTV